MPHTALSTFVTLVPPPGGRIHIVRVPVDPGRDWHDAVSAVGPDTRKSWDVWKVGEQYPPQAETVAEEEVILGNFGKTIPNTKYALDWAKPYGLVPKGPRSVFAVAEHNPDLRRELQVSYMGIVSPVPCMFGGRHHVCHVWLDGVNRYAYLYWFERGLDDRCWFAFSRGERLGLKA